VGRPASAQYLLTWRCYANQSTSTQS